MRTACLFLIACGLTILLSCQREPRDLTEEDKILIVDSTTQVARKIIESVSRSFKEPKEMISTFELYFASNDNVRHTSNGLLITSLEVLIDSLNSPNLMNFRSTIESFEETPDRFDVLVLSRDVVSITVPAHYKIKAKGLAEYNGQEVLSFLLQKINGRWLVTQSHISEFDVCKAMAALMPPPTDRKQ